MRLSLRRYYRLIWPFFLIITSLVLPQSALSQVIPRRDEVDPERLPTQNLPGKIRVDSRSIVESTNCPLDGSDIRINLMQVRFESARKKELSPKILTLLDKIADDDLGDQSVSIVCKIRDRANAALRSAGFIASIQIPPQDLSNRQLILKVVTANIVEIRVRDEINKFEKYLIPRLKELQSLDPVNESDIERILLIAGDIPGLDVQLSLRQAGSVPGDVIGELTVKSETAAVLFNLQNSGSKQLGREVASLRSEYYGLTGLADRTVLTLSNTLQFSESHVVQLNHDIALGSRGTRLAARASVSLSRPDIPNLDLRSRSLIGGLEISTPLIRKVNMSLATSVGFEFLDQRTKIGGGSRSLPFSQDQLRVGFLRFDGAWRGRRTDGDEAWRVDSIVDIRQGLGIFGASNRGLGANGFQPSRFDGDPEATIVRGSLEGAYRFNRLFSFEASVFAQWANHSLLNIEEFSLGNLTFGRGYDPGDNGGDRVVALRAEPRLSLPPFAGLQLEFMGFYDWVRLFNLDSGAIETGRVIRSAGGGIRLRKPQYFVIDLTYAKPLDRALLSDVKRPGDRVLLTLTTQLYPWRSRR